MSFKPIQTPTTQLKIRKLTISDTQLDYLKKSLKLEWKYRKLPTFIILDGLKSQFTCKNFFLKKKYRLYLKANILPVCFTNSLWTPFFFYFLISVLEDTFIILSWNKFRLSGHFTRYCFKSIFYILFATKKWQDVSKFIVVFSYFEKKNHAEICRFLCKILYKFFLCISWNDCTRPLEITASSSTSVEKIQRVI